ncbi:MAG TPA: hypothetical protein VM582_05125 [Candidatus Thermoplasmatota archaeon]|nr:hypothetical protein [Candidatus Thermoplasmatota archaeon]
MLPFARPPALLALCLLVGLPLATAQTAWEDNGTLTLHDEPDGPETIDVADCVFWVRGQDVVVASGTVDIYHDMGRGGATRLLSVPFEGTPSGDGRYDFIVGPLEVDSTGHTNGMRIYAEVVIEPRPTPESDPARGVQGAYGRVHCGATYIPCIADLTATALDEGDVRLEWTASANATIYYVYRSDGVEGPDGRLSWVDVGNTTGTSFVDATAEAGETYVYDVTASDGRLANAEACELVQVTAVPFFGAPLLAALALVGGVGAFAWMRRGTRP